MSEMQQQPPSSVQPSSGMSITEVWMTAVTQPNEEAYSRIANDPNASTGKAMGFLVGAWAISFIVAVVLQTVVRVIVGLFNGDKTVVGAAFGGLIGAVCAAPFAGAIGAMFFIGLNGLTHLIASALGGKGTFDKLIWTVSAYMVPMFIISLLLGVPASIPWIGFLFGCLSLGLSFYMIYLNILSVKVVHQLEWMQASIASLAIWIGIICLCAIVVACMMVLLGPVIGNVFSSIQNGIQP